MINKLSNAYGKIPLVIKARNAHVPAALMQQIIRALMTRDILPYMFDNSIICPCIHVQRLCDVTH